MTAFKLNPVYAFAAGHGDCHAQSELAASCCTRAESLADENPDLADEYFMAAEVFAELACTHRNPRDVAVLAGIFAARSLHSALRDPVRSLEYREQAEPLFDVVESSLDSHALAIIAFALNGLADADPDDDRASVRLNRIIDALPPAEAHLLREAARSKSGAEA